MSPAERRWRKCLSKRSFWTPEDALLVARLRGWENGGIYACRTYGLKLHFHLTRDTTAPYQFLGGILTCRPVSD